MVVNLFTLLMGPCQIQENIANNYNSQLIITPILIFSQAFLFLFFFLTDCQLLVQMSFPARCFHKNLDYYLSRDETTMLWSCTEF